VNNYYYTKVMKMIFSHRAKQGRLRNMLWTMRYAYYYKRMIKEKSKLTDR